MIKLLSLFFLSTLILGACSTGLKRDGLQYVYIIQPGDTLSAIARRYRIPVSQIASWNNLKTNSVLQAGKALRMSSPSQITAQYKPKFHTVKVKPWDTLYSIAFHYGLDYQDLAALNGIRKPYTVRTGQVLKISRYEPLTSKSYADNSKPKLASKNTSTSDRLKQPVVMPKPMTSAPNSGLSWMWPTQGKLTGRFGKTNKGIDISGKTGQRIIAASSGQVVYSGNSLPGYGNLIIVKHNNQFLSAYAFNQKLYVKEGESVKKGQHIADMGRANAREEKLHFEVRYKGRPVNPLKYLPAI